MKKPGIFLTTFFLAIINAPTAHAIRNCIDTGVPFLINGRDSGYNVEIMLSNYSDDYNEKPEFGIDKEAHWEVSRNGTVRVYFHPKTCYGKFGRKCQYYLYVGIHHPRTYPSACSGYDTYKSVKGKQVNFTGSFRFISGSEINRKSFYITPAYGYANSERKDRKVCAFNNYGGKTDVSLWNANMAYSDPDFWHNIYWGTWYDRAKIYPGGDGTPSEWVHFKEDLNQASRKAEQLARIKWPLRERPHFKKDYVVLEQASIGPEYGVGNGELVFEVKNLNLIVRD